MVPESIRKDPELLAARWLVWLYFWLLIFEGAIAKWVLPTLTGSYSLTGSLFLIRDCVLVFIYLLTASRHRFPKSGFIFASAALAVLLAIGAQTWGHRDWLVTLDGLRINFLHLPLIFIIPELFSLDDVRFFGRCVLGISIPLAGLVVCQFLSPTGNILNTLAGSPGAIRPSGIFYSVSGLICFLAFQAAFIAGSFLERRDTLLCVFSLVALFSSLICGLNIGGPAACLIVLAVFIWGLFINPKPIKRGLIFIFLSSLLAIGVSLTPVFKKAQGAIDLKIGGTNDGSFYAVAWQNFKSELSDPFETIKTVSLAGAGTGAGTTFAADHLIGNHDFHLATNEWSRLLLESGLVLGISLIVFRIVLMGYLLYWGVRCVKKSENFIPWILCAAIFPLVVCGGWDQPTLLGFMAFGGGLILAATRKSYENHPIFKHAYSSLRQ